MPKGKQLDHFVEKTVNFIKDPPSEPICYRRMMADGYALPKLVLGTTDPDEKIGAKGKPRNPREVSKAPRLTQSRSRRKVQQANQKEKTRQRQAHLQEWRACPSQKTRKADWKAYSVP